MAQSYDNLKREADKGTEDMALLSLPQKLFEPHRIIIMKILLYQSEADFQELKHVLSLTDGNLASHLRALEAEGFIGFRKDVHGRKVRTMYHLTKKGHEAFKEFSDQVKVVFANVRQ